MNDLIKREDAIESLEKVKECLDLDSQMFVDCLIDDIKRIEPFGQWIVASKWISCSERLPEQDEQVFVYLFGNSPYIAWYNHINKKWRTEDFELDADEEPKEWLPLPNPHKGE